MKNYKGILYENPVHIISYQRTGHHGIMHWLFSQLPHPSAFRNAIRGPWADRFALFSDNLARGESFVGKSTKQMQGETLVVLGHNSEGRIDLVSSRPKDEPKIVVIRDVKNWAASLIKGHGGIARIENNNSFETMRRYLEFALDKEKVESTNSIVVNFPQWHVDVEYRRTLFYRLCSHIGVEAEFTDAGKDRVMGAGGGSSFSGRKFDGNASQMDVLNRYRSVNLPPIPQGLLDLNDKIFPEIYEWRG